MSIQCQQFQQLDHSSNEVHSFSLEPSIFSPFKQIEMIGVEQIESLTSEKSPKVRDFS